MNNLIKNIKNKLYLLFVLISTFFVNNAFSQQWIDTVYSIQTVQDVEYGTSTDFAGVERSLLMDISYPIGDTIPECGRPLLVMIHGGAWIAGDKAEGYAFRIRKDFAKRGYTTASVNYRLGQFNTDQFINCNVPNWNCYNMTDSSEWYRANYRAVQDVRGAIRYLVNQASTYNIDPNNIFVVGESAGGFIAMGVGFMDDTSEILSNLTGLYPDAPTPNSLYENTCIQNYNLASDVASMDLSRLDLGSDNGMLNLPVVNSYKIKGVGNFFGGVFNNIFKSYHPNPPALYLYHQPCDLIVPYNHNRLLAGYVNCLTGFPTNCSNIVNRPLVYGSFGIKKLIDNLIINSIPTTTYYWDHSTNNFNCYQQATNPNMACHAIDKYWLRTTNMATFFASKINSCNALGLTEKVNDSQQFNIFPNPASSNDNIYINGFFRKNDKLELFNINGIQLYEKILSSNLNQIKLNLPNHYFKNGIYFIQISNRDTIEIKKILIAN